MNAITITQARHAERVRESVPDVCRIFAVYERIPNGVQAGDELDGSAPQADVVPEWD